MSADIERYQEEFYQNYRQVNIFYRFIEVLLMKNVHWIFFYIYFCIFCKASLIGLALKVRNLHDLNT